MISYDMLNKSWIALQFDDAFFKTYGFLCKMTIWKESGINEYSENDFEFTAVNESLKMQKSSYLWILGIDLKECTLEIAFYIRKKKENMHLP